MATALEPDGHRVEWTIDPADAVTFLRARPDALVVSDVGMPRMSGTAPAVEAASCRPRRAAL